MVGIADRAQLHKRHTAKKLEAVWETDNRKNASKLEYGIKKNLTKLQKENLITNKYTLSDLFSSFDVENYKRIK